MLAGYPISYLHTHNMKLLLLTLLVAGASAGPSYTTVFSEQNGQGSSLDISDYVPDLLVANFDNVIDSVRQTGMWIYYDNINYNIDAGKVYFVHGIDISVNFPADYVDMSSSVRFAGSPFHMNEDTWTLYEGKSFTGQEYYGNEDSATLGNLAGKTFSIVLTGTSPWTVYCGENWVGISLCIYPDTDHDTGADGSVLDFGIYPDVTALHIPEYSIYSIKKGCWSNNVATPPKIQVDGRQENGAWGHFDL
ncbi:uncharacterized protein LOC121868356 [Homarus americanus]|uniref:Putative Beta/Gamma crystallin-containing protein 2 n=1 Tax=Homarus americanus TaxID=6706 RepID=A0A8J5K180_HOMAM|nr:uncharacterized protein LOC121868356 [Homarus americanus]KAG7167506.1 putative Beta/Gamma crystallin-containing protein 2 [Homarus americanus]